MWPRNHSASVSVVSHKCLILQAAALATCQFLATESSRPEEPPAPSMPEPGPEMPSTDDAPAEKPQKPHKHKHRKKPRARRQTPPAPPALVQQLVEMGFSRQHVERALKELAEDLDPRRAEMVVAWLLDHPSEEVSALDHPSGELWYLDDSGDVIHSLPYPREEVCQLGHPYKEACFFEHPCDSFPSLPLYGGVSSGQLQYGGLLSALGIVGDFKALHDQSRLSLQSVISEMTRQAFRGGGN